MNLTHTEIAIIKKLRAVIATDKENFVMLHSTPFVAHDKYTHIHRLLDLQHVAATSMPSGVYSLFDELKNDLGDNQAIFTIFYDDGILHFFRN